MNIFQSICTYYDILDYTVDIERRKAAEVRYSKKSSEDNKEARDIFHVEYLCHVLHYDTTYDQHIHYY